MMCRALLHIPLSRRCAAALLIVVFIFLAPPTIMASVEAESDSAACPYRTTDGTCYGAQLKRKHFFLAEKFTNLNHGSYGTVSKPVHNAQERYFIMQESYPDKWFRKQYYEALDTSRQVIAQYVGAAKDDVVLVENASSAVNSILRSMGLKKGDKVLRLNTAYGMVVNTLNYLSESAGVEVIVAEVTYPVTGPDQIVHAVQQALLEHTDMKLCVFSHISSLPAIVEPLHDLVDIVRTNAPNAQILVDGAHAPGQIELDVPSYEVDYYLGNCHKWLYAPKGTAFLWVDSKHQTQSFPEPTVISSANSVGRNYVDRYSYTGTRDYTHFAALPEALEFRKYLGGEEQIRSYCHNLAVEAGRYLAQAWNTDLLVPAEMSGFMINVILPSTNSTAIKKMQEELNERYGIFIVYGSVEVNEQDDERCKDQKQRQEDKDMICNSNTVFVTRLSAQVYLSFDDFKPLGYLVPQLLQAEDVAATM